LALFVSLLVCFAGATTVLCQQRIYRGSIGGSHVEMRLSVEGNRVSGSYSYDRIGEDIKLSGQITAEGGLELTEFDARHKPSGKIGCKRKLDDPIDPECYWSRVDGSHQAFVALEPQQTNQLNGLRIVPKTINDRATNVVVSYPQLASNQAMPAGAEGFNKAMSTWIKKAVKDFDPESSSGRASFDLNYNVLLSSNDLISIEVTEYADNGGAHPNTGYWAMTYDLNKNKELRPKIFSGPKAITKPRSGNSWLPIFRNEPTRLIRKRPDGPGAHFQHRKNRSSRSISYRT